MTQPGFNFFGHVSGNFGLGVAARSTLAWLLKQRQLVCLRDVSTHDERAGQNHRYDAMQARLSWGLPFDVNFFHVNPPELMRALCSDYQLLPFERRLNVALPFWELPSLLPQWCEVLAAMDVVLAPSRFIQSILQDNLPETPCFYLPASIDLPRSQPVQRGRFGIPEGSLTFLCAFDLASDVERKNPWGAIQAFQAAFAGQESVRLLIKLSHAGLLPETGVMLEKLRRTVEQDARLILIDRHLPQDDLFGLFASCDALVSLHRAEGLGQILMEMMALGKPVITTAWSGNMDFCTPDNACLVDYDLVPVRASHHQYQQEAARTAVHWAEPRHSSAVSWMRRLHAESALRLRLGQQAAQDMRQRSRCGRDGLLDNLRTLLASPAVRAGHEKRARWLLEKRLRGFLYTLRTSPGPLAGDLLSLVRDRLSLRGPAAQPQASLASKSLP